MTDAWAAELEGLFLVFFGTRVEVVAGDPGEDPKVVVDAWLKANYPENPRTRGGFMPPLASEIGARPLTARDVQTFTEWDPRFLASVKKTRKKTRR